jgi:serine/threonine protein phosphatase PrpC
MIRTSNEDSCIANINTGLFLVADGMGGHAAGEIASQIAASTVEEIVSGGQPTSNMVDLLQFAVQQANLRVYETQRHQPEYRGMGSTLTALVFRENHYYLAQVGDSRAYLVRDHHITQLTRDHSVVWPLYEGGILSKDDISRHPQKNLITRSIGTHPEVEIDLFNETACVEDIFLLCSDGLTDVLTDREIQHIMTGAERDPQNLSEMLIRAANSGGGPDNVTTVVVYLAP